MMLAVAIAGFGLAQITRLSYAEIHYGILEHIHFLLVTGT